MSKFKLLNRLNNCSKLFNSYKSLNYNGMHIIIFIILIIKQYLSCPILEAVPEYNLHKK